MHLVIYGREQDGHVTINGDSVRVKLRKNEKGEWVASDPRKLRELRTRCGVELASIFALLLAGPDAVRPVTS